MNYYLARLTSISPVGGHQVQVVFTDGFTATLDLAPWIARGGIREALAAPVSFAPFAAPVPFGQVIVNDEGAPEWPGEIDLSPGTLRAWCEAGRVLTKEETDAWITRPGQQAQAVA